ncbi:MAG: hypothetical protein MUF58_19555 [Arcicella sp.]|nr:hypothetical protein [Arcicella sp.]
MNSINNTSPIRWGMLACGKIAEKFADDLVAHVPDAIVYAVASRDIAKTYIALPQCGQTCIMRESICYQYSNGKRNDCEGPREKIVFDGSNLDEVSPFHC